jgi:hypothetical protein
VFLIEKATITNRLVSHYAILLLVCLAQLSTPAAALHDTILQHLLLMPADTFKVDQLVVYGNRIIDIDANQSKSVSNASKNLSATLQYVNGLEAYWLAFSYM